MARDEREERQVRHLVAAGLSRPLAHCYANLGVTPEMLSCAVEDAAGFIRAAEFYDLAPDYVADLLRRAAGDPDRAWELWAAEDPDD